MEKNLVEKLIKIESKFLKVIDILEEKGILEKDLKYQKLYKGFISIQSKIIKNPRILFLGINPGEGAFNQKNFKLKTTHFFPKDLFSEKTNLNWLKYDNAREKGEWFETNKKIKNKFPKQFLDILFNVYGKTEFKNIESQKRFIDEITDKIVYTNICPIATKNEFELKKIYTKLSKEKDLKKHWNGTVENFFKQRTIDLILLLQPKLIVCAGKSVYKSLFSSKPLKNESAFLSTEIIKRQDKIYPVEVITFSRKGAWDTKKISKLIIEKTRDNDQRNCYKII
jgi:hypothetical protein